MVKLFVCENELADFTARHPEYNTYKEVYDKYGELDGYVFSVEKDNIEED